jgi:hypothetical protein
MAKYATWEGAKTIIARVKNGKVLYQPLGTRREDYIKRESHKQPIGVIMQNMYDNDGNVLSNEKVGVYYKGKNVEVLGAKDLEHPDIPKIENSLIKREDLRMNVEYIPGITYEPGMGPEEVFRKKKSSKTKPKRKVIKKKKSCGCK